MTIPVAEATVSKQPFLPQVQSNGRSKSTVIWPSSPATPPAPCKSFPSATIPPPTPVPSVMKTTSGWFSPAPFQRSPRAATLASLSMKKGIPKADSISFLMGCTFFQLRLYAPTTVPSKRSTAPGDPIPIPIKSSADKFNNSKWC